MSLFGQQQPAATGGGLFGSSNNTGSSATGGGLFGSTPQQQQQQPQQGGGVFGGASQPASGGLFGGGNTQTGSAFGSAQNQPAGGQQQQGSSLFGSTNTTGQQPQQGGGLFGSTANTGGGGLFGSTTTNPAPSGGIFGTQPSNTNPLFGGQSANPQQGSSLFGQSQQQPQTQGSSLFGPQQGSSLFGQTQQQPQNQGGGLFGTQPTNPQGSSLFGQTQQQQPQNQGSSLFGQSTNTQQGSSLFGQPQQQPQQQGGLFGSTLSTSALKSTLSSQNNSDPQSQFNAILQRIDAVKQAWDSNSQNCRFQHYFYNLVDPNQVRMYGRPNNSTNEVLWQKAVRENPDSSCMVPVLAVGFDDLQKRVDAQTKQASAHQEKLQELKKRIETLSQRHDLSNASRLHRATSLQTQLTHRLLRLVQHLHLLIPALRSSSIRPEEEALRSALEEIDEEIRRPGGMGRMRGKLNELWALVGAVSAARERDGKGNDGAVEWAVVDDEGLAQIAQILAEQQAGLAHLTKILQKDLNDIAVIRGTAGQDDPNAMST